MRFRIFSIGCCVLLTSAFSLSAQEPATSQEDQVPSQTTEQTDSSAAESEWIEMFNGKDLSGWSQLNGTAKYEVIDGAIKGTTATGSPNSFLCTDSKYSDFELMFEVKVDSELNSGVQIRSLSKQDYKKGRVHGLQIEIEAAPGESGYIYSEATGRNWISKNTPVKDAFQNDQWNQYRVLAQGRRIQTWVNGHAVEDIEVPEEESQKGFIGLQVHGIAKDQGPYSVQWRKLKIRELSE